MICALFFLPQLKTNTHTHTSNRQFRRVLKAPGWAEAENRGD